MLPMMSSAVLRSFAFSTCLIELPHQMLLQGLLGGDGIEKELAFFFVFLRAAAVAARLRHVIAPFVIELGQLIEFLLEILVARRGFVSSELRSRDRFGELFQDGVGFHFLLDQIAQFEQRRLKNEQALLKLRRENLLQRKILRLMHSRPAIVTNGIVLVRHSQAISTPPIERKPCKFRWRNANCS